MLVRDISPGKERGKSERSGKPVMSFRLPLNRSQKARKQAINLSLILVFASVILITLNIIHLTTSGLRLKNSIVQAASSGFEKIVNGAVALGDTHFKNAEMLFREAEETFTNIRNKIWFVSPKIPTLALHDPTFDSASALISAGKHLSNAGMYFTKAAQNLQFLPKSFFEAQSEPYSEIRPSLTEKLKLELPGISSAVNSLAAARDAMEEVPEAFVPQQLRNRFRFAKDALVSLSGFTNNMEDDMPAILNLLGDAHPHTFLILLQNNAEIRPTGGFIGNYMILETNDGYVVKNDVFDVYGADHQLTENIPPPAEILPINPRWYLRDANYSGHFPLSAAKVAWFLEKENGPGVDSVIAIDQGFVSELLRLTGPVRIPQLAEPLTANNFSTILSYIIESKLSGRENPKAILQDFMPALEHALFDHVDPISLMPLLRAAAESKHLYGYSKDPSVQAFFERHGIAGTMKELEPKEDYLNIVHTSIGGNKSDTFVAETITHDTYLKSDGSVTDELTITRSHQWTGETQAALTRLINSFGFYDISERVYEILGRGRNIHMLRVYVPAGATLESSSGPDTSVQADPETGKTYFSLKMETPAGKASSTTIRYRLPFILNLDPVDKYTLTVQKQAGQNNTVIQKRIFPESRVLNYKYFPETGSFDIDGVWHYEGELNRDMNFSSIWGK